MMELPSFGYLFAGLLFGSIGFAAFIYGKKHAHWQPMVVGVVLMVYPYFIATTWLLYLIGVALCAGLYLWRD